MKPFAPTAQDLAAFFHIHFWHTTIDLPAQSYVVELCEFANRRVTRSVITCDPLMSEPADGGVTIMIGGRGPTYEAAMRFGVSTALLGQDTTVPKFDDITASWALPPKVRQGDFVLFSVLLLEWTQGREIINMPSSAKGFLIRIRTA